MKRIAAMLFALTAMAILGFELPQQAKEDTLMELDLGRAAIKSDPDMRIPLYPPEQSQTWVQSQPTTFEIAQSAVDFPILQPTFLPNGEFLHQVQLVDFGETGVVVLVYRGDGRELVITQDPAARWFARGGGITVPDVILDVEVSGRPAAYYTRETEHGPLSSLVWEQGDVLVEMQARGHTQEEMIQVAESMDTEVGAVVTP